jgi:hypothetical protein
MDYALISMSFGAMPAVDPVSDTTKLGLDI